MAEDGKTVGLSISIWYVERDRSIHISSKGGSFITTVNNQPGSKRSHPHLYNQLRRVLQEWGKWPAGADDGSEKVLADGE